MKNMPAQPGHSLNLLEYGFVKRAKTFLLVPGTRKGKRLRYHV